MWAARIYMFILLSCALVTASDTRLVENGGAADSILATEFGSIDELFDHMNTNWPPFDQIINRETSHCLCINDGDRALLAKLQIKNLFKNACDGEASGSAITLPGLLLQMSRANYVITDMNAFSACALLRTVAVLKRSEMADADLETLENNLIRKALSSDDLSSKRLSYACSCLLSLHRDAVRGKIIKLFHVNPGISRFKAGEMCAILLNTGIFFLCCYLLSVPILSSSIIPHDWDVVILAFMYSFVASISVVQSDWYYTIF